MAEQNFQNHTKFTPAFHFFVVPVFVINFVWSIFRWKASEFSLGGAESVVMAFALVVFMFVARIMALTVQNRVVRLEERLRYERLLPADLQPRIGEFTLDQLVSLRFASDAELPALARKVLAEKLIGRKAIKRLVKVWKPDYLRA